MVSYWVGGMLEECGCDGQYAMLLICCGTFKSALDMAEALARFIKHSNCIIAAELRMFLGPGTADSIMFQWSRPRMTWWVRGLHDEIG